MALIPSFFADTVVAIGAEGGDGQLRWAASGFLYGQYVGDAGEDKKLYRVYVVTNRHVVKDLPRIHLRFNPQAAERSRVYDLALIREDGSPIWFASPDAEIDVAVIPINFDLLKEHAMQVNYFRSDRHVADIDTLIELGITEGDFAYVLGFPMGLVGGERNAVVIRSGSIARIRDALTRANREFLVDAFVFPGNSGGPVVSKPEALAIEGTKSQHGAYLIGIVKSYVPYEDVAISVQTRRPRVIFEENSGLAAVHPIDFVQEAVEQHLKVVDTDEEAPETQSAL
jgi:S1-C subfamily serine protease